LHETATFTATVHSAHGATPTGTISFFDHGQLLQAGVAFSTIGNGLAIATFTSSGLSAGAHTISAVYTDSTGDGAFTGSTSSNVIHVVDFHPLPLATNLSPAGSFQAPFVAVNGTVFFAANDGTHGQELWETTGTGTQLVSDINPGPGSSYPTNLTNVNGTLFFSATDGVNGAELWMSNGTAAGTTMVKDINPGSASSSPASLTNVNGVLFFSANDGTSGVELWRSNGTSAGTVLVKDIDPGSNGSYPSQLQPRRGATREQRPQRHDRQGHSSGERRLLSDPVGECERHSVLLGHQRRQRPGALEVEWHSGRHGAGQGYHCRQCRLLSNPAHKCERHAVLRRQ